MTAKNFTLTQKKLKEILHYNHETGVFTWLKSGRGRRKDLVAGCKYTVSCGKSYLYIAINYKRYPAHRLAMLYMRGFFPLETDHISGCGMDNSWLNLRDVSHLENSKNQRLSAANKSGCTGVCWHKRDSKWVSGIRVEGKYIHLGVFKDIKAAITARKNAERKYVFHDNHGTDRPL